MSETSLNRRDPYKDRNILGYLEDMYTGIKLGWKHRKAGVNHFQKHNELGYLLSGQTPDLDPGEYDQAKNWQGGYDWGYRLGETNAEDAREMARIYQGRDYPARPADSVHDYYENLDGVEAGIQAQKLGQAYPYWADLNQKAIDYARRTTRKPLNQ